LHSRVERRGIGRADRRTRRIERDFGQTAGVAGQEADILCACADQEVEARGGLGDRRIGRGRGSGKGPAKLLILARVVAAD
jgi:hypothetical protein